MQLKQNKNNNNSRDLVKRNTLNSMKDKNGALPVLVQKEEDHTPEIGMKALTGLNATIRITEDQMRYFIITTDGIGYVHPSKRYSAETEMLRKKAAAAGYPVKKWIEADTPTILRYYENATLEERTSQIDIDNQRKLANIIRMAADQGASDIRIKTMAGYTEITVRVFGRLKPLEMGAPMSEADGMALISAAFAVAINVHPAISIYALMQGAIPRSTSLLPLKVELIRLQYTPLAQGRGSMSMRLLYDSSGPMKSLDTFGYADDQIKAIDIMKTRTNGAYILAGKVSSGKTTTLRQILTSMHDEKNGEISFYAIEDPAELKLKGAIEYEARGPGGFEDGIVAALRSDANVIALGEVRSKDVAESAIRAVMTGHALWTTIHAGTALGILDRLLDIGIEPYQLADPTIIRGLIYQRLCGTLCKNCRISLVKAVEQGKVKKELANNLCNLLGIHPRYLYERGDGCDKCQHIGYGGRTVVAEYALTDEKLLTHFKNGERKEMREYWTRPKEEGGLGCVPVMHHALVKVGAGICSINEVEEEVDLLSNYMENYPSLVDRLRQDIKDLVKKLQS